MIAPCRPDRYVVYDACHCLEIAHVPLTAHATGGDEVAGMHDEIGRVLLEMCHKLAMRRLLQRLTVAIDYEGELPRVLWRRPEVTRARLLFPCLDMVIIPGSRLVPFLSSIRT